MPPDGGGDVTNKLIIKSQQIGRTQETIGRSVSQPVSPSDS